MGYTVENFTKKSTFEVMVLFLESFYERTTSDDVGGLAYKLIFLNLIAKTPCF